MPRPLTSSPATADRQRRRQLQRERFVRTHHNWLAFRITAACGHPERVDVGASQSVQDREAALAAAKRYPCAACQVPLDPFRPHRGSASARDVLSRS